MELLNITNIDEETYIKKSIYQFLLYIRKYIPNEYMSTFNKRLKDTKFIYLPRENYVFTNSILSVQKNKSVSKIDFNIQRKTHYNYTSNSLYITKKSTIYDIYNSLFDILCLSNQVYVNDDKISIGMYTPNISGYYINEIYKDYLMHLIFNKEPNKEYYNFYRLFNTNGKLSDNNIFNLFLKSDYKRMKFIIPESLKYELDSLFIHINTCQDLALKIELINIESSYLLNKYSKSNKTYRK